MSQHDHPIMLAGLTQHITLADGEQVLPPMRCVGEWWVVIYKGACICKGVGAPPIDAEAMHKIEEGEG